MKCGKVKNPCKICLQTVSNKNGLQCKGACKKWAHFKCLNYTPGKISDIKAGLITITCPCPGCTTAPEPKEVLTNPPFTCTNEGCPATKPPVCEVPECPNKQKPIPLFIPPNATPPKSGSSSQLPPECPVPAAPKCPPPPCNPPSPKPLNATPPRVDSPPRNLSCPPSPINDTSPQRPSPPVTPYCVQPPLDTSSSNASPRKLDSPPTETATGRHCTLCPTHCPKHSNQNVGASEPVSPQRSQSCTLDSPPSCHSGKSNFRNPCCCSSDSALLNVKEPKILYCAIEQICDTMGNLSVQLKDLLCKLMDTFQKNKQK